MNRKSRHGQSFRKKVEKNKRERAIQNAKKQERLKALKRERLNAFDDGRDKCWQTLNVTTRRKS